MYRNINGNIIITKNTAAELCAIFAKETLHIPYPGASFTKLIA